MRYGVFREDALRVVAHDLVGIAGQEAEPDEPLRLDARGRRPDPRVRSAGPDLRHRGLLRSQHDVVDRALLPAEAAVRRIGPRDVGRIVAVFSSRVVQDDVAVPDLAVVRVPVQEDGIRAGCHDRGVRHAAHAVLRAVPVQRLLDLELVSARRRRFHRQDVPSPRDLGRAADESDLVGVLDDPQLVKERTRVDDRRRRGVVRPGGHCFAQLFRPLPVSPVGEIDLLGAGQVAGERARARIRADQMLSELLRGKRRVRAVGGCRLLRADAGSLVRFGVEIVWPDEDHVAPAVRSVGAENEDRLALLDAADVPEVGILPIEVLDVVRHHAVRRGAQDRDRVRRQPGEEPIAVRAEHRRRRPEGGEVERGGCGERTEEEDETDEVSWVVGPGFPVLHLLEMNDQGAGAAAPAATSGRTTASIRPRWVLSNRRTGVPAAASSRMSAADSSAFAR